MGGAAPGWYPDYERPPGHQRYWDGERWTERRLVAPAPEAAGARQERQRVTGWVGAGVAALVATCVVVLVVGGDRESGARPSQPPPASTPGPAGTDEPEPGSEPTRRTYGVSAAVDGETIRLDNGAEVRLAGITDGCGTLELARLVVGQRVTLTRAGADRDVDGRFLRYVEREGLDVGRRLLQRGLAGASAEANPRRAIYRRIDERSPSSCA